MPRCGLRSQGVVGGLMMLRLGINRALWVFGFVQMISILGFAWLAGVGAELWALAAVIAFEYFGVGLGTAAFYRIYCPGVESCLRSHPVRPVYGVRGPAAVYHNASTGFIVESTGWVWFFLLCTVLAIPGMVALVWVAPWRGEAREQPP